jgi:hypothetical protein
MDQYWASKPADQVADDLLNHLGEWNEFVSQQGIRSEWERSYAFYYGRHFAGKEGADTFGKRSRILEVGKDGQLKALALNHYRNFIQHIMALTTSQKFSFDCRATNSDVESLRGARIGNNVLDAYIYQNRFNRHQKLAAEQSLVFGKSFNLITWDQQRGRPHIPKTETDPETGEQRTVMVHEGDVRMRTIDPLSYFTDSSEEDFEEREWEVTKEFVNKFNIAATLTGEIKDKVLALPTKSERQSIHFLTLSTLNKSQDVPVWTFWHRRTPAMPNGRMLQFCEGPVVLYDGPIPYKRLPSFRIVPGEIFGTTEGYTPAFDLMAPQEALNILISAAFSNQSAFGVQNVLIPDGCNLSVQQLSEGLAGLKYNAQAGKPEALQLTSTPAELFKLFEILERTMETLSGVNSVARGNPEHNLKSGVALGLVQAMAVQYSSGFQQSWAELAQDEGMFILECLRDFASNERLVAMSGKKNRGVMQSFKSDNLKGVARVIVDLGNPLARTVAGRTQMADSMLDKGLIKTPQEYVTVLETGQIEPMLQSDSSSLDLIYQENEAFLDGKYQLVQAIAGDAHLLHMQEHKCLLDNPEVRMNAQMTQAVLAHIQHHAQLYRTQDPIFSQIAGEPPAPPPPMMGPPGGPVPPPQPEGAPGGGGGSPIPPPPIPGGPTPPQPLPPSAQVTPGMQQGPLPVPGVTPPAA